MLSLSYLKSIQIQQKNELIPQVVVLVIHAFRQVI